jgi:threonine dehydratase
VQVNEHAIAEAMHICFDDTHQIAEDAGAAPLAALLQALAGRHTDVGLTPVALLPDAGSRCRGRVNALAGHPVRFPGNDLGCQR